MSETSITPCWRNIVVGGREIWAYVGAGRIEAHAAPDGIPLRATIDGADYEIQVTRMGAATFEADILGPVAPPAEKALTFTAANSKQPLAPKPEEDSHDQ